MKKKFTYSLLSFLFFSVSAFAQPNVTLTSSTVPASTLQQGANANIVYVVQMSVASQAVTVNNIQVVLSGTHDADDLSLIRIYFNATAPTISGASNLTNVSAAFAAPHTYSVGINRFMAAGSSGYFIIAADV